MGRYFGTDGVRGKANETLTLEQAYKIGRYLGYYYDTEATGPIIIGKDTRLSGDMLEHALAAGAAESGADVVLLGVCTTPAIAFYVTREHFACGVMISASHNPYYDNGIKVFSHEGTKINEEIEALIEDFMDGITDIPVADSEKIGRIEFKPEIYEDYLDFLKSVVDIDLSNMNILLDLANGSATSSAVKVLSSKGAKLTVLNDKPDGVNINLNCGSTHPEMMCEEMKTGKYDIGLAFDGDADRLISCDETGEIVDGDKAMYILGKSLNEKGLLKDGVVVTTVMSNMGLYKILEEEGMTSEKTAVGDKYVYDCMVQNDYKIGGEQSGHIILKDLETTGDGLLTALKLLEVMVEKNAKISTLANPLHVYPQLLVNVQVKDKVATQEDAGVQAICEEVANELGSDGRLLVRPSGTEPLLRVMVEAQTDEICHDMVYKVIDYIKERGL